MTLTYGDWFSGGGGSTIGAMAAGLDVVFGAEYREDVADVYRMNLGDHVRACDLTTIDVAQFPYVDVFHASPPCPNFSNAKANGEETDNDRRLAEQTAAYISHHRPMFFTLENVYAYRNSESWRTIAQTLLTHGYSFNYWHVNMADYGVPQTRRRMIVIARRDGRLPQLPVATHAKEPVAGLFGRLNKWVSWYEAIADMLIDLDEWTPTERVTKLYPDTMPEIALINTKDTNFSSVPRIVFLKNEPSFSITVQHGNSRIAVIVDGIHYRTAPKHLARFQSFPDWYELPDKNSLACYIIGNAVPPLFAEKLYRSLI